MQVCKAVLERAKPGALVLMDEMGSGTDPAQGVALAQVCRCTDSSLVSDKALFRRHSTIVISHSSTCRCTTRDKGFKILKQSYVYSS